MVSLGTFPETLIRLKAFKRIFIFRSKIDFFPRGIFSLTLSLITSFVGYFFVPAPLGRLKSVSGDV